MDASAQDRRLQRANETFDAGEYYMAIDLYRDAYQNTLDKSVKPEILFKIAECYRLTNEPRKAELWYNKALAKDYQGPLAVLYYAEMLKMNEEYEDAKVQFEKYMTLVPDDPRGKIGLRSCEVSQEWKEFPSGYEVEEVRFFNSRASDYAPSFARDDYKVVYFTSSREETTGNEIHGATGQGFSDIFYSVQDIKGKWSTPQPLGDEINTEGEEGTPSLPPGYGSMYFTRCKMSKNKAFGCEIMVAQKNGEEWDKVKSLELAGDSLVVAHPAISADETALYFVSDMQGTLGGKDIWRVTRASAGDEWGEIENLGDQINTPGDEVFPYVHPDGTLYFSSDSRLGMGGLDIYKANVMESGDWKVENMRYPINSPYDDFGIAFEAEREAGFFSSTRDGRSDDIYAFLLPPLRFSITGVVKNEADDQPIANAKVKSISSAGITLENETDDKGNFKFMLKPNTDYVFIASKEGFLNGKEKETTKGLTESTDFETEIYLASIAKPIELPNIIYDFGKWELRPESMVSLDQLVETLNDNPNITIELMSHTDARASEQFNQELSQKRAQVVVDYLTNNGISPDRLSARGYGESKPRVVDERDHAAYPFLELGQSLTEEYIESLEDPEHQEIAHQLNRRTEFKVLRTDYVSKQ